tara:strand:+ start:1063 stop:1320 length:258 start_codon:yes stop_codon:yes gene_type:complete
MIKLISKIIDDTLKREKDGVRRFSRTSLTMLSAWIVVLYMAIFDQIKNGLHYEVWIILATISSGIKIADRFSKPKPKEDTKDPVN